MGINRATLCWRSVDRESRAAGKWKTREETTAHRNTPYHISETHTQSLSVQVLIFKVPLCSEAISRKKVATLAKQTRRNHG